MSCRTIVYSTLLVALFAGSLPGQGETTDPAEQWRRAIDAFAANDERDPVPSGGILFLGSSSIRMWNTGDWFPDLPVLNRGFGGSQISDSLYFLDQLVFKYEPKTLVFYAGDNDIARGKSAKRVVADFQTLVQRVHGELPGLQRHLCRHQTESFSLAIGRTDARRESPDR